MKLIIIALLFVPMLAFATDKKKPDIQVQDQHQKAVADSTSKAMSTSGADAVASNEGNSFETNSLVESSAPDIILVPNNNTANCQKVYGLSFSTTGGGAGIGWPYRDKSCDFESAADDAAANGQHTIAWYWRCHKKNLYKQFNGRAKYKEQQIEACHLQMMRMFVKEIPQPAPEPLVCPPADHPDVHHRIFAACVESK